MSLIRFGTSSLQLTSRLHLVDGSNLAIVLALSTDCQKVIKNEILDENSQACFKLTGSKFFRELGVKPTNHCCRFLTLGC